AQRRGREAPPPLVSMLRFCRPFEERGYVMAVLRDAIVLVPGARIAQQGAHLDVLINGLRNSAESVRCGDVSPALIAGLKGKRLPCTFVKTGETKQVDFFECYMSDLVPNLSQQSVLIKLRDGTKVLLF